MEKYKEDSECKNVVLSKPVENGDGTSTITSTLYFLTYKSKIYKKPLEKFDLYYGKWQYKIDINQNPIINSFFKTERLISCLEDESKGLYDQTQEYYYYGAVESYAKYNVQYSGDTGKEISRDINLETLT